MLLLAPDKKAEARPVISAIKEQMLEWKIVTVRMPAGSPEGAEKLLAPLAGREGIAFLSGGKLMMLLRDEKVSTPASFKAALAQAAPGGGPAYVVRQMTRDALEQVGVYFSEAKETPQSLFGQRLRRAENRVLIIDDDAFYQGVMRKACEKFSKIYQSADGKNAVEMYREVNPDIVFLDIHLPFSYGFFLLEDFLNVDFDAFVIMNSGDGSPENILKADTNGAAGFMKKPLDLDELKRLFDTCPSAKKAT